MAETLTMSSTEFDGLENGSPPVAAPDPDSLTYHKLCAADEIEEGKSKPFTVEGTHLAVFKDNGSFHAVDNRCPHMGYPMSEGTVRDGVLICHWHHWAFDLKTGGCFLTAGDDLKSFPLKVEDDGYLYVGLSGSEQEEARRRLIDRGKRTLEQGLKDRSSFLIAKAVTALRESGATPQEIIQHGLFYGAYQTTEGFSSGEAILSIAAYVMAALHLRRTESQEAGFKYFLLGALASALLLYGKRDQVIAGAQLGQIFVLLLLSAIAADLVDAEV